MDRSDRGNMGSSGDYSVDMSDRDFVDMRSKGSMNIKAWFFAGNRRTLLQRTALFLCFFYICLALCGCTANNKDLSAGDSIHSEDSLTSGDDISSKDNLRSTDQSKDQNPVEKNEELRKSGISLPLEESRVIDISIESEIMGRKMPCKVYLPKGYGSGETHPVWYGLHGYGSDESMWIDQVGIAEASDELVDDGVIKPMIMVFPYTRDATMNEISKDLEDDGKFGERNMDRFICEELVPYIDSRYDTAASAGNRYIGGFSMGGMIAVRIAFHHPDMFSKVGGYSAAVISSDYSGRQLEEWLFPYDNVNEVADIVEFDRQKGLDRLTVYLNCGTNNDPFLTGLQSLCEALQQRGIPAELEMYKGGHDLEYSKANAKGYLLFYAGKH
ncbi:MAG: esterase family protein [Clostridiaceae bacterium]|jgi:enterochelin esterase-like enzyme|nr:esterase family protein [Clostridiaceae bacterium]